VDHILIRNSITNLRREVQPLDFNNKVENMNNKEFNINNCQKRCQVISTDHDPTKFNYKNSSPNPAMMISQNKLFPFTTQLQCTHFF
jgi:hypothetical protein